MLGPLVSVLSALAVAGLYLVGVRNAPWWGALIFGTVTLVGSFLYLSRRVLGKIEPLMAEATKHLQAGRVDPALQVFERAMPLAKWHPLIGPQLHAQIGSILYIAERNEAAEPHLRKAPKTVWTARAMLACLLMKRKDAAGMNAAFEELVTQKKLQKESLLWTVYAFCALELGGKAAALPILERAHQLMRGDERIEKNLERVKEGKPMKTQGYGQQWLQFRIGEPPRQQQVVQRGGFQGMHPALRSGRGGKRRR